ncbi:unnamed protein product [Urochloa humidicola]
MASSSTTIAFPSLGAPTTEKLTRDNFLLWKAQIMPAIRGAQLTSILDGSIPAPEKTIEISNDGKKEIVPNPAYDRWLQQDQQLLSYLVNSLSKEVIQCF